MQDRQPELALVKVAEDVVAGERFRIIQLDVRRGVLARSQESVDADTVVAQLLMFGCDTGEIADLLAEARKEFIGLF